MHLSQENKLASIAAVFVALAVSAANTSLRAKAPRVLPVGEVPADTRLGPLRGETGDFSFVPPASPQEWQQRSARLRRIMRVTMGLWPMPTKTPLQAVVHGKLDLGDYTIEKVYFQSLPGLYVTGSLYRPKGKSGKLPAVLSPHGHFPGGRFQDEGLDTVRRKIVVGAERFEEGGRSFMQSRCVQLARMGCVVLHYDMLGYADNRQIPLDVAHRFSRSRVQFDRAPDAGFYSAGALLQMQNQLGLHTYNSIRALDLLTSLPDVDPDRIAVTGGSGGGTQTFMLCAVDSRPLVAVPVVIVSTTRQGGCTCENIAGFRIGTYNLEFTALHAPKPLLLISADDATRSMQQRGFPELQAHYQTLGAAKNVAHVPLLHFPHNYNYVSRAAMYRWVNRHLKLGLTEPIVEGPYRRLTEAELTVFDDEHPAPAQDPETELRTLQWLTQDARRQIEKLTPRDDRSLRRYRELVGGAWDILLRHRVEDFRPADAPLSRDGSIEAAPNVPASAATTFPFYFDETATADRGSYRESLGLLRYRSIERHQAELPIVQLVPKASAKRTVVWGDGRGKSGLFDAAGKVIDPVQTLLSKGYRVIGVDLLGQGEFGEAQERQRALKGEEAFAGWTYCYNMPLFARRVHDLLAVIAFAESGAGKHEVDLVALGDAGKWAIATLAQARGHVARAVVDSGGFRFANVDDVYHADFLPGAAKYGDVPALLALAAPCRILLAGEERQPPSAAAAFEAAAATDRFEVYHGNPREITAAAIEWLAGD